MMELLLVRLSLDLRTFALRKARLQASLVPLAAHVLFALPKKPWAGAKQSVHACAQIGRFLTTTSLPSVSAEACVLANAASGADPAGAAQHILGPLLAQLEAELPALAHASGQLSKVPCRRSLMSCSHAKLGPPMRDALWWDRAAPVVVVRLVTTS